jgi:hypothetical protein
LQNEFLAIPHAEAKELYVSDIRAFGKLNVVHEFPESGAVLQLILLRTLMLAFHSHGDGARSFVGRKGDFIAIEQP